MNDILPEFSHVTIKTTLPVDTSDHNLLIGKCSALGFVFFTYLLYSFHCGRRSSLVARLLQRSGLSFTHLSTPTPPEYKLQSSQPHWMLPRGVLQRNAGLTWLRNYLETSQQDRGVLYFADDDNTYDLRIFEEVRISRSL